MTLTKDLTYDIKDINLAEKGRFRMQWAAKEMPAIRALVLASQVNGRLCVVGYATEGLTVDNANEMLEQFSGEVREAPFVTCRAAAIWINPKFICNVKYKEWDANQGLIEPMFDGMLKILP